MTLLSIFCCAAIGVQKHQVTVASSGRDIRSGVLRQSHQCPNSPAFQGPRPQARPGLITHKTFSSDTTDSQAPTPLPSCYSPLLPCHMLLVPDLPSFNPTQQHSQGGPERIFHIAAANSKIGWLRCSGARICSWCW